MDRLIEFVINHYVLVTALVVLVVLLIITESRRGGATVSPQGAVGMINRDDAVVVDLRKNDEFNQGHIAGSINIPMSELDQRLSELRAQGDHPLILVCENGTQTGAAGRQLRSQGMDNIWRISGGLSAWRNEKLPVVQS